MKVRTEYPNILVHTRKYHLIALFLCSIMLIVDMAPAQASTRFELGCLQASTLCVSSRPNSPAPASVIDTAVVRSSLAKLVGNDTWKDLELPGSLKQKWQAFAEGEEVLSGQEIEVLSDYLSQIEKLQSYAAQSLVPPKTHPVFRAQEVSDDQVQTRLVAYAVEAPEKTGSQAESLFMITTSTTGLPRGLALAPQIDGLQQHISTDGNYVEYWNNTGKRILRAQGRAVPKGIILNEALQDLYHHNEYAQASIFPRFDYPDIGVDTGFYGLEDNLTYQQILLLGEALQLFNRPELAPMKNAILNPKNDILLYETLENGNAGINYVGSNVIGLDRKDLFWNKYYLASVIAHEGTHVMQGPMGITKDVCAEVYHREIANRKIPQDLYNWNAEEVIQAIKDNEIGTYHVSVWFLHLFKFPQLDAFKGIILTGKVSGKPLVNCSAFTQ